MLAFAFVFVTSEDTRSLQAALEKYKRAVETSVQGGVLELGLRGFGQALIDIASRDSIKARNMAGASRWRCDCASPPALTAPLPGLQC